MLQSEGTLDGIFFALSDATRRRIIEVLVEKDHTVMELSALFNISLPAVSKHLKVLSKAGLMQRERDGRFIICSYNDKAITNAMNWITEQHRYWKEGFDAIETYLNTVKQGKK